MHRKNGFTVWLGQTLFYLTQLCPRSDREVSVDFCAPKITVSSEQVLKGFQKALVISLIPGHSYPIKCPLRISRHNSKKQTFTVIIWYPVSPLNKMLWLCGSSCGNRMRRHDSLLSWSRSDFSSLHPGYFSHTNQAGLSWEPYVQIGIARDLLEWDHPIARLVFLPIIITHNLP